MPRRHRAYGRWTPEEEEQLRILARDHQDRETADLMGRTAAAIGRKRFLLGLPRIEKRAPEDSHR